MRSRKRPPVAAFVTAACAAILALAGSPPAAAGILPSSDVLMPYFEVDLGAPGRTSLFAIANHGVEPIEILVSVHTNWGIPVLEEPHHLDAEALLTANLRDWLVLGRLPTRQLDAAELAHLEAALSGQPSPRDGLYYGTEVTPDRLVGYVRFRVTSRPVTDSLWGDYYIIEADDLALAQGETLANLDQTVPEYLPCKNHVIRYLNRHGSPPEISTEFMVWTGRRGQPSATPEPPAWAKPRLEVEVYGEDGDLLSHREFTILPVQWLDMCDVCLREPFGWVDFRFDEEAFVTGHVNADPNLTLALHSYCVPEEQGGGPSVSIDLVKAVNGVHYTHPPGALVDTGDPLTWTFEVTNTGDVTLEDVTIDDVPELEISCPKTVLEPGESMTCTAASEALACLQRNTASAVGYGEGEELARDQDVTYYTGAIHPSLKLAKKVNGDDADVPPGPQVTAGTTVAWTFVVTNTGDSRITDIVVTDDGGLAILCPATALEAGASMTCTATSIATAGQHHDTAKVAGLSLCGDPLDADDAGHYYGTPPPSSIQLLKLINGSPSVTPPGPGIERGTPITWGFVVSNTGQTMLTGVAVTDDPALSIACPKTVLAPGESMTCTAQSNAEACLRYDVARVVATNPEQQSIVDEDWAYYFGLVHPGIDIEKLTNGQDADVPPGPELEVGAAVVWSYIVTNIGDSRLLTVVVTDTRGVAVSCPKTTLEPGESMTCTGSGTAVAGQYSNIGSAVARSICEAPVSADDPSHYFGTAPGNQGCTPGYWKNHTGSWPPTGYSTGQTAQSVFAQAALYPPQGAATLLQALAFGGGPGTSGAAEILLRAAVAGLLNAAHPDVAYPRTPAAVIADVNVALQSNNRDTMLALAALLDADNNRGCPLS